MFLERLANIAEIIGTVMIIVSLIYVAIQIRQNTAALRVKTAHDTADDLSDWYLIIAERGELADIFLRGLQDHESLGPVETLRFFSYCHKYFRSFENAYYQFCRGALEREFFEGITQQFISVSTLPGVKNYWRERKSWYHKTFQTYVDWEIMTVELKDFKVAGARA